MEFSQDSFAHGRVHGTPESVACEGVRHKNKVVRNKTTLRNAANLCSSTAVRDSGKEAVPLSKVK